MKKTLFIGALPKGEEQIGGETIKNKIILGYLADTGLDFDFVDTFDWKKNKNKVFVDIFIKLFINNSIILSTSTKSALTFLFISHKFNLLRNKTVYYFVIGGTLKKVLDVNPKYIKCLNQCESIYVESKTMVSDLKKKGLKNIHYLPNFKKITYIPKTHQTFDNKKNKNALFLKSM